MKRALAVCLLAVVSSCGGGDDVSQVEVPGVPGVTKSSAAVRAQRRSFEGAPPVIPHEPFGVQCTQCHTERGLAVQGVGFAPPSPHERTKGMSAESRCNQCHVFRQTDELFVPSNFVGWRPDDLRGSRAHDHAPPVMPHPLQLRENCIACHSGPAAREEIRTTHPERANCKQCHVRRTVTSTFARD